MCIRDRCPAPPLARGGSLPPGAVGPAPALAVTPPGRSTSRQTLSGTPQPGSGTSCAGAGSERPRGQGHVDIT
eukprot:14561378-Alexandrium_andersonii.AAC.1